MLIIPEESNVSIKSINSSKIKSVAIITIKRAVLITSGEGEIKIAITFDENLIDKQTQLTNKKFIITELK